jgi:hypothetical protein
MLRIAYRLGSGASTGLPKPRYGPPPETSSPPITMKINCLPVVPRATFGLRRKVLAAALVFMVEAASPVVHAAVTVLSHNSRIYGSWWESVIIYEDGFYPDANPPYTSYYETGSFDLSSSSAAPLSMQVTSAPFKQVYGKATTSSFSLDMMAYAEAEGLLGDSDNYLIINAQTITRFKPRGTHLTLGGSGITEYVYDPIQQGVWLRLRDVTSGATLLNEFDPWPEREEYKSFSFTVDPTHEYELDHGGFIIAFDSDDTLLTSRLELASVPDGGHGTGVVALAVWAAAVRARRRSVPAA